MNFQDLKKIEDYEFYLDKAFKRAKKKALDIKKKTKDRSKKGFNSEKSRIDVIKSSLTEDLRQILLAFPSIDSLDMFYQELIKTTLDYKMLKKSLGSLNWAVKQIGILAKRYTKTLSPESLNRSRTQYYGRISSVLKQIKKNLRYLEHARQVMRSYPAVKTSLFTVCLFGFPNVGKSTLLSKITSAQPEIKAYAFTTKRLNFGYISEPGLKIQVIDTPGTLDREKMNDIELQAYLALKHLAQLIVFVYDPTMDAEKQKKLLRDIKKRKLPMIIYISKTDMVDEIPVIAKNIKTTKDTEELIAEIKTYAKKHQSYKAA